MSETRQLDDIALDYVQNNRCSIEIDSPSYRNLVKILQAAYDAGKSAQPYSVRCAQCGEILELGPCDETVIHVKLHTCESAAAPGQLLADLGLRGISYHAELADEGTPWESIAEPEPQYFATFLEAYDYQIKLASLPPEQSAEGPATPGQCPTCQRLRDAANLLIDYCEAHGWGMTPEPYDSINPLLKLLGREALAGESAPPRQFSATTESWLCENESAKYGLDPLIIPTHVVQELLGCARMARSPETTPAPPQDKWLENFTLDLNDAIEWAEQDSQGRALDVLYEMRDKIQARLQAASPETPRGETPEKESR